MQQPNPTERRKTFRENMRAMLDVRSVREFVNDEYVQPSIRKGREEGGQAYHVAALLRILRQRTIWLAENHVAKLKSMTCAQLPSLDLAFNAEDAADFARRAGLNDN